MERIAAVFSKLKAMDTLESSSKTTLGQVLPEDYQGKLLNQYINDENYSAYEINFNIIINAYFINNYEHFDIYTLEITNIQKISKNKAVKLENQLLNSTN